MVIVRQQCIYHWGRPYVILYHDIGSAPTMAKTAAILPTPNSSRASFPEESVLRNLSFGSQSRDCRTIVRMQHDVSVLGSTTCHMSRTGDVLYCLCNWLHINILKAYPLIWSCARRCECISCSPDSPSPGPEHNVGGCARWRLDVYAVIPRTGAS